MKRNEELEKLLNEVINTDERKLTPFERFIKERAEALAYISAEEREKIETIIKIKLLKMFKKRKGDYFYYEDILEINEVKKYFNIITTTGDRNIGKSTSGRRIMRNAVQRKKRFIVTRNIQEEIKAMVRSDDEIFLKPNGWTYTSVTTPDIKDSDGNIVGYYRDINTIAKMKSVEFPDVSIIVAEEFNTSVGVNDKFKKFVEFVTTVQRHREDLKIILQANYIDQNDEILQKLGVGLGKMDQKEFVKFNWITGALLIFIPFGIYKSTSANKDKKRAYLGHSMSLMDFNLFQEQYGGGFNDEGINNVINLNEIVDYKPIFNIYYYLVGDKIGRMTLYNMIDKEGGFHQVLTPPFGPNNKPILTFDNKIMIRFPNAVKLKIDSLNKLITNWQAGKLKTSDKKILNIIVAMFSRARDFLEKEEEFGTLENIF